MESKFLRVNLKDFLKGLLVAIIAAVIVSFISLFDANGLSMTLKDLEILMKVIVSTGGAYIVKNLITDSSGEVMGASDNK